MTAKLSDVAEKAGVSITTVSRVINRKGYLSAATIAKVEAAMKELHYAPNAAARSLQGKSLKLIGLIFPNIHNVFYAELIEQIEHNLFSRGYKAILATTEHDEQKERDYLALLLSNQVDGIIYGSHNLTMQDYANIQAPIIAFDRLLTDKIPIVSSDNFQGGVLATEALIRSGAKHIGIFTGDDNTKSPTSLRREGYLEVMSKNKLKAQVFRLPSTYTNIRKESEIKKVLSENQLDGIFCTDDLTALLVKNLAQELKQEPHIIGFDGSTFMENYHPELTTVQQAIPDLAQLLVDLLIKKIQQQPVDLENQLPVKIRYGKFLSS